MLGKRLDQCTAGGIDHRHLSQSCPIRQTSAIGRPGDLHHQTSLRSQSQERASPTCRGRSRGRQRVDPNHLPSAGGQPGRAGRRHPHDIHRSFQTLHLRHLVKSGIPGKQPAMIASRHQHAGRGPRDTLGGQPGHARETS